MEMHSPERTYCSLFVTFTGLNIACFDLASWMFSMKYWAIAQILESSNNIRCFNALYLSVIVMICLVAALSCALIYLGELSALITVMLTTLYLNSFAFLLAGLLKISRQLQDSVNLVVDRRSMTLHLVTFGLFIAG